MDGFDPKTDVRYQNLKKKQRAIRKWLLKKIEDEYKNKGLKTQKYSKYFSNKDKELEDLKVELKEIKKLLKEKTN